MEIIDSELIELQSGENNFKIKVFDNENYESSCSVIIVNEKKPIKEYTKLHLLSVGISDYGNSRFNLFYAKEDAKSIIDQIYRKNNNLVDSIEIIELTNSQATKENLIKSFNKIAKNSSQNDIFIFYFAGHGLLVPETETSEELFNLSLFNSISSDDNSIIRKNEIISTKELSLYIEKINARKQLIIIDACNSGKAIEIFDFKKDLSSFAWKTGVSLLSATGSKSAWELHSLKHGLFTYIILDGINGGAAFFDNQITVASLKSYIDYHLPIYSRKHLSKEQIPFGWVAGTDFTIGKIK